MSDHINREGAFAYLKKITGYIELVLIGALILYLVITKDFSIFFNKYFLISILMYGLLFILRFFFTISKWLLKICLLIAIGVIAYTYILH